MAIGIICFGGTLDSMWISMGTIHYMRYLDKKKKEFHDRNSSHYISNARIINIIQHILKVEILKSVELDESDHSAKLMREL